MAASLKTSTDQGKNHWQDRILRGSYFWPWIGDLNIFLFTVQVASVLLACILFHLGFYCKLKNVYILYNNQNNLIIILIKTKNSNCFSICMHKAHKADADISSSELKKNFFERFK